MILIANMICDCRFLADTICPGLFCSSKDSCDAIHFFTMFFYSCSQWPSCFSNVDTFTVFTRVNVSTFVRHLESTECRVLGSQRGTELLCTPSVLTMSRLHRPQHDSAATIPDYVTVEHPCDAICNHKRAKTVDAAAVC